MSSRKRPLGVDVGPEQRAQAPPLVLTHPVMELGGFQNGLHEQGVDVHQRRLEQVKGEHPGLGVREQAQQQPSAQGVAVDHLTGGDRGELGAELGEEVGVLEHVEQVEIAPAADHLVLDRGQVARLGQRRQ